jgi:L-fuculose-phosphate aldolase
MTEEKARAEVVRVCRMLHERGYLAANDGNVSVRLDAGQILVTPTGVHKGFLEAKDLLVVDASGRVVSGEGKPTGELAMHLAALRLRPDARCIVHSHPPTCIALSLIRHLRLDRVLPEVILSIGRLAVVPSARPISEDLGAALTGYVEKSDALILERHGTLTLGDTPAAAYALTERLEHAAHVLWLAHAIGRPVPLPEAEARALERMYERRRAATH